jgi:hypothetical protein
MLVDYTLQEYWRVSRMVNILGADVTSGYLKVKIFRSQSPKEKALLTRLEEHIHAATRERFEPRVVPLERD